MLEIVQKKRSNKHTFTFDDEQLNYAYADRSGSGDLEISYAEFPRKTSTQIEENSWLRNVGFLWMALGILQFGYAVATSAPLKGKAAWLILGIICLVIARYTRVIYTVFHSKAGPIHVIQGRDHDRIIEEVRRRQKAQILDWHGEVNAENGLDEEITKFRWLAKEGFMTHEESELKISQAMVLCGNRNALAQTTSSTLN